MRFSRYSAQQDSLAVFPFLSLSYCPLTDVLSAIRRYNSLYPLITGKTSYPNSASPLMWVTPFLVPFYLIAFSPALFLGFPAATCFPMPHAVSSIVSSAASVLTVVFGMGTGVSPKRIATGNFVLLIVSAENILSGCGKLAFLRPYEIFSISDVVATEELCSEVHLPSITQQ